MPLTGWGRKIRAESAEFGAGWSRSKGPAGCTSSSLGENAPRQAIVRKGRNRDTAWYAAIDKEWPALGAAFEQWLSPSNFDEQGRQRVSLSSLTRAA